MPSATRSAYARRALLYYTRPNNPRPIKIASRVEASLQDNRGQVSNPHATLLNCCWEPSLRRHILKNPEQKHHQNLSSDHTLSRRTARRTARRTRPPNQIPLIPPLRTNGSDELCLFRESNFSYSYAVYESCVRHPTSPQPAKLCNPLPCTTPRKSTGANLSHERNKVTACLTAATIADAPVGIGYLSTTAVQGSTRGTACTAVTQTVMAL